MRLLGKFQILPLNVIEGQRASKGQSASWMSYGNQICRKNSDQSEMHCWGQRSGWGQLEGKILRNALLPTN